MLWEWLQGLSAPRSPKPINFCCGAGSFVYLTGRWKTEWDFAALRFPEFF